MKVFVSYSWKQGPRVWGRLVPVLQAAGMEVLIDRERFVAGKDVLGQMDAAQDVADKHILCLSAEYAASKACQNEMRRAIASDPRFADGKVIPLRFDGATVPSEFAAKRLTTPKPLWIEFADDMKPDPWTELLGALSASLGSCAIEWLSTRDRIVHHLQRRESVYLLLRAASARWKPLLTHLQKDHVTALACVDLDHGRTIPREGLLNAILKELAMDAPVRPAPDDLGDFHDRIEALGSPAQVALVHFENAQDRGYGIDLFRSIRKLVNAEPCRLVLMVVSRAPLRMLLPARHPMSEIAFTQVELP